MPEVPLPITGPAFRNTDESELDTRNAYLMNVLVNELGDTVKAPGLELWSDLGSTTGTDGLYWWDEQGALIAINDGRPFKITSADGSFTPMHGVTVPVGNKVSFTSNGPQLIYANGGQIVLTTLNGSPAYLTDTDAPTQVPYVMLHDQYAIAIKGDSSQFQISEVGDITTWRAQDIFTAESRPDKLLAGLVSKDGVLLLGRESGEFWINDGVSPFSRVRGLSLDRGLGSAYSLTKWGDEWFWIDEKRNPIRATIQGAKEIPNPYLKQFQNLISVEDALSDVMVVDGWPLWVMNFPLANRTFVYNINQNDWSEWGAWDTNSGTYRRFPGNSYAYAKAWGFHIVGDYRNGHLYKLTRSSFSHHEDIIRSVRRTGFITHGTTMRKRSKRIRIRLKRSTATSTVASPVMMVRWRERNGPWSNERQVSLGEVGQHDVWVELNQLGMYQARQYEFIHTDATDWIMADAKEDIDVMTR
jgi:hypothetical protein